MREAENLKPLKRGSNSNTRDGEELQNLDNCYPYIIEKAQEGVWIVDKNRSTKYVNERMTELAGSTLEEMKEKTWFDFLFKEDSDKASQLLEMAQNGINKEVDLRLRRSNGSQLWVHVSTGPLHDKTGNYVGMVGMFKDITAQKEIEEALNALRESEENMRLIIDSVKDYAILSTDRERHVLSWNSGAEAMFGYTEQEVIGKHTDIIFTPEDRQNGVPEKETETACTQGRASDDRWHLRKDGSRFFVSGVVTPLYRDGKLTRLVKIARDLTDRKHTEEILKKADRQKTEFLATLAHELRNPLASIYSGIEVLHHEADDKKRAETQETIERQLKQIIHLVDDLLDISRISQGKLKLHKDHLNLSDAINLALEATRPIIRGYRHELTVSLPEEPIFVNGDMTRLSQVFLNLLLNAAKYTTPGGTITLAASRENNKANIRLRDNGMGIPKHMLSRIFEMFAQIEERTEHPHAGLGIGLSVVKQLVEMHGGEVKAYSDGEHKGSEFVVTLPITEDPKRPTQEKRSDATENRPEVVVSGKRILIIDDNTDAADMLGILLRKKGYTIQTAYDGKSGIDTALKFQPEIVLLDIGLPDIDGYAVAKTLQEKQTLSKQYLIALSGWGQEEDLLRTKRAGFYHHLVKPVEFSTLEKLLNSLTVQKDEI